MPFEFLTLTKAKLSSVNVRSEKHGPELVPAVDIKLAIDASNAVLDKFHPDLKESLYFKATEDDSDDQADLDGIEPVTDLPNLRFPKLEGPLKWDLMGAGYALTIDYGLGGNSNLVLHGCVINNFAFDAKEGGTVELALLVQHEVSIILTAPEAKDVEDVVTGLANPFLNQDPAPLTPEQALIDSVEPA